MYRPSTLSKLTAGFLAGLALLAAASAAQARCTNNCHEPNRPKGPDFSTPKKDWHCIKIPTLGPDNKVIYINSCSYY